MKYFPDDDGGFNDPDAMTLRSLDDDTDTLAADPDDTDDEEPDEWPGPEV